MAANEFSEAEVRVLGLDQLSAEEVQRALRAFNGFTELFDRAWVEAPFQGASIPDYVRMIFRTWEDWSGLASLQGADEITKRWRRSFQAEGVLAEIRAAARLVRAGVEFELFPAVGNRKADGRFRVKATDPWVYMETSQRGISEERAAGQAALQKVAVAAADASPGFHGKVAILRPLDSEATARVVAWLLSKPQPGAALEDLAQFHVDALKNAPGGPDDVLDKIVSEPAMNCSHLVLPGPSKRGTAKLQITDLAAESILKTEAAQLPRDEPGVVVLLTSHPGGYKEWEPLIRRRLRPSMHTRVSAVVLVEPLLNETRGVVILNDHAARPLGLPEIEAVRSILSD